MTRKDYILIAEALRYGRIDAYSQDQRDQHEVDAAHIADALARDNPRFDRERFLKAAGVQS